MINDESNFGFSAWLDRTYPRGLQTTLDKVLAEKWPQIGRYFMNHLQTEDLKKAKAPMLEGLSYDTLDLKQYIRLLGGDEKIRTSDPGFSQMLP